MGSRTKKTQRRCLKSVIPVYFPGTEWAQTLWLLRTGYENRAQPNPQGKGYKTAMYKKIGDGN
jgi:hypothetical protein